MRACLIELLTAIANCKHGCPVTRLRAEVMLASMTFGFRRA